jgi:hypothetical protein
LFAVLRTEIAVSNKVFIVDPRDDAVIWAVHYFFPAHRTIGGVLRVDLADVRGGIDHG